MESDNLTLLVDARTEYTKQLVNILKPHILQGIISIFNDVKEETNKNDDNDNTLINFQNGLSKIPKWSKNFVQLEYERILSASNCDWINDLITAVFICHTKVLTSVQRKNGQRKKTNIKVPKSPHFIHLCYIECAREFWKNPYLFSEQQSQYEYQRNIRDAENMIADSITETVRKQLPVKNILKEYLGNDYTSDIEDEDDITKEMTEKKSNKLKEVVKKEVETNQNLLNEDSQKGGENTETNENNETNKTTENMEIEENNKKNNNEMEIDLELEEVDINLDQKGGEETTNQETTNQETTTEEPSKVREENYSTKEELVENSQGTEQTNYTDGTNKTIETNSKVKTNSGTETKTGTETEENKGDTSNSLSSNLSSFLGLSDNNDDSNNDNDNNSDDDNDDDDNDDNDDVNDDNDDNSVSDVNSDLDISEIDDLDLEIDELTEMDSEMSDVDLDEESEENNSKTNEFSFFS